MHIIILINNILQLWCIKKSKHYYYKYLADFNERNYTTKIIELVHLFYDDWKCLYINAKNITIGFFLIFLFFLTFFQSEQMLLGDDKERIPIGDMVFLAVVKDDDFVSVAILFKIVLCEGAPILADLFDILSAESDCHWAIQDWIVVKLDDKVSEILKSDGLVRSADIASIISRR